MNTSSNLPQKAALTTAKRIYRENGLDFEASLAGHFLNPHGVIHVANDRLLMAFPSRVEAPWVPEADMAKADTWWITCAVGKGQLEALLDCLGTPLRFIAWPKQIGYPERGMEIHPFVRVMRKLRGNGVCFMNN